MAIALLVSTNGTGNSASCTTSAIDTTGASLLIAFIAKRENAGTMSDSKGNTWNALTASTVTGSTEGIFYYASGSITVGTGHTFTFAGANTFPRVLVSAWSGVHGTPFDQQNGAANASTNSLATGSITPSEDNELVVAGCAYADTTTISVNASMTIMDQGIFNSGSGFWGGAHAYIVQTSAGAINPTFSFTNAGQTAVRIASFKAAAAGGSNTSVKRLIGGGILTHGLVG